MGRVLLILALVPSVGIGSSLGEALVLHQHGAHGAHLHILSSGELFSNAALSATFGHTGRWGSDGQGPELQATHRGVRILGIVSTGLIAVSTPRDTGPKCGFPVIENWLLARIQSGESRDANDPSSLFIQPSLSASALLMLRNHVLLI